MFERYPSSSVRALFVAKHVALAAHAEWIDVDHLFLGSVEAWPAGGSLRASILQTLGVTTLASPFEAGELEIPFSPRVKRLLNQAMAEANHLGHHRIRPEHLLLAILEEPQCAASAIMRDAGLTRDVLLQSANEDARIDDSPFPRRRGHFVLLQPDASRQ